MKERFLVPKLIAMKTPDFADLETDPRFPSGPWIGFFLQKLVPGRHLMELSLSFRKGTLTGEGRDRVGDFIVRGRYDLQDGKCYWTKRYLKKHDVFYQGYNEGKGIWGNWEIPKSELSDHQRGGFHIWPKGLHTSSDDHLAAEADEPAGAEEILETCVTELNHGLHG